MVCTTLALFGKYSIGTSCCIEVNNWGSDIGDGSAHKGAMKAMICDVLIPDHVGSGDPRAECLCGSLRMLPV